MPKGKATETKCPSCGVNSTQIIRDNNLATCKKCQHTYIYKPRKNGESNDQSGDFSDMSDVSVHSDDYVPSRDDSSDSSEHGTDDEAKDSGATDDAPHNHQADPEPDQNEFAFKLEFDDSDTETEAEKDQLDYDSDSSFDEKIKSVLQGKKKSKPLQSLIRELKGEDKKEQTLKKKSAPTNVPSIFDDFNTKEADTPSSVASIEKNDYAVSFSESDGDDHDIPARPVKRRRKTLVTKESSKDSSSDSYSESEVDDDSDAKDEIGIYTPDAPKEKLKAKPRSHGEKPTNRYNPYIEFNKLIRKELAKKFPNMSNTDLSKKVADAWRSLAKDEKDKFIAEQKAKREQMHAINEITKPPKVPAGNGYLIFSKQEMPKVKRLYSDAKTANELSAIIGVRWKDLPQEERDAYHAEAKKERDEWIKEHPLEFEAHMERMADRIRKTKAARAKAKKSKS